MAIHKARDGQLLVVLLGVAVAVKFFGQSVDPLVVERGGLSPVAYVC